MSVIQPFNACIPDVMWLRSLKNNPLKMIQGLLEPGKKMLAQPPYASKHRESFETLKYNKLYRNADSAAVYLYEQETVSGSQFGIWALTSLEDMVSGKIVTHEDTLPGHLENISAYRSVIGLEGKPVLLSYERQEVICKLIEQVATMDPDFIYSYEEVNHRLWAIKDMTALHVLREAFDKVDRVYVADGHHRLAAAKAQHFDSPQWISSLYITTGQLRCREFHRVVIPEEKISESHFLNYLQGYGSLSLNAGNQPYKPEKPCQFGVCLNGNWYILDQEQTLCERNEYQPDVCFLQDEILKPFFGICNPGTDARLQCWPANKWEEMLEYSRKHTESIVFTMHALSPSALIEIAENHIPLPPKSTYMEPKVPYGLLIYDHKNTFRT